MEDIFALDSKDFTKQSKGTKKADDPNIYDPTPEQGKNGVYKAIIRGVPYMKDKSKTRYQKFYAMLKNPLTGDKTFIDCPSTIGQSSILWDLATLIKKLKDEEPEIHKELSENFSRNSKIYSPFYIKQDSNRPDMVGKIKIVPYGVQIDKLFQDELNPDPEFNLPSVNCFHPLSGKDLMLTVTKKTKQFRDFSSSKFYEKQTPLIIKTEDREIVTSENPKVMKFVQEWLLENTPDMEPYFYKPWKEEDYAKIAGMIVQIVHYPTLLENLLLSSKDTRMVQLVREAANKVSKKSTGSASTKGRDLKLEEDEFTHESPTKSSEAPSTKKATGTGKAAPVVDEEDDPFSMLND